jgi:hypothetical protein
MSEWVNASEGDMETGNQCAKSAVRFLECVTALFSVSVQVHSESRISQSSHANATLEL